jgi:hypothetical protein
MLRQLTEALRDIKVDEQDLRAPAKCRTPRWEIHFQSTLSETRHLQHSGDLRAWWQPRVVGRRGVDARSTVGVLHREVRTGDHESQLRVRARRNDRVLHELRCRAGEREKVDGNGRIHQHLTTARALQINLGDRDDGRLHIARCIGEQKRDLRRSGGRRIATARCERAECEQCESDDRNRSRDSCE